MKSILIKNALLNDGSKKSILIQDNKIKKIAKTIATSTNKVIDANGALVLPGFINAHMHYYSSFARGLIKARPSKNFVEILNNLWWRLDKKLTKQDLYYSALIANVEAIKHGTTTLIDHHASPGATKGSLKQIAKAVEETGIRASLCYELSDRDGEKAILEGIEENLDVIKNKSDRLMGLFGLHASFTLSEETLKKVVELVDKDLGFHIHVAEDKADQRDSIEKYGKKVVARLADLGILRKNSICVHCVHIDDEEMDLIVQHDAMVVHNPQSNMNNAVGVANLLQMLNKGILVGLGTDAMTTNMLEELRAAIWLHKLSKNDPSVAFMECCGLLMENNKKIVERLWPNIIVGELKEGATADIVITDYLPATPLSADNFYGHLVFGVSQHPMRTTIAGGKILMENFKIKVVDEIEVNKASARLAKKFWDRF